MNNSFEGKVVLVTGAAGFIGSHLCDELLARGAKVTGIDNLVTGRRENLSSAEKSDNFSFIEANVSQPAEDYLDPNTKFDLIFHFASPASPKAFSEIPEEIYQVNSFGTHHLLNYLKETNPEARFVFASTSEAYGDPKEHPQKESYWGNVNPNGPRSCYDESKRFGEMVSGVVHRSHQLDTRIVRIFNTYGPRINPVDGRVIPNFISQALAGKEITIYGDGSQTRSYCYVADLVEVILLFGMAPDLAGETINIGNPDEHTILETAEIISGLVGSDLKIENKPLPPDDPARRQPDITKARELLGWSPRVSFEEGLKKTIDHFKKFEI